MLCVNLLAQIMHMQLLMWLVPHNGDTAPKIGKWASNDSLIVENFIVERCPFQSFSDAIPCFSPAAFAS